MLFRVDHGLLSWTKIGLGGGRGMDRRLFRTINVSIYWYTWYLVHNE